MKCFAQICILLITMLCSCTQERKYPYRISDFKPRLQRHLTKLVATGQLFNNPDTPANDFLKDSCTKDEIIKLLSCENPIVRIAAYRAVVNRNEPDYFSILKNHLDDTAKVTWWYYDDAAADFAVSDLMIRKATEDRRKLSHNQKDTLVSLVLLKHPYLEISNWMISEIGPSEKYYTLIRKKAKTATTECGDQMGASYALAKFKKPEDIPLLKANLLNNDEDCTSWAFKTIENFPDTSFYPILTKYFNYHIREKKKFGYSDLKYYCLAIASYKNENSLKILTALINKGTYSDSDSWYLLPQNKENVFLAIQKYRCPLYNELYSSLKLQMDGYILAHLNEPNYADHLERRTW